MFIKHLSKRTTDLEVFFVFHIKLKNTVLDRVYKRLFV